MRVATLIARVLLGLIFLVFGLNGFLHFIPNMQMPPEAVDYFVAMGKTGYELPGLFVPLGLALLAPVIVNILLFHFYLAPGGLGVAIVVVAMELFLVWSYRAAFAPMLRARPTTA